MREETISSKRKKIRRPPYIYQRARLRHIYQRDNGLTESFATLNFDTFFRES
jgi:hypothetical protein